MTTLFETYCDDLSDWDTTNDCEVINNPTVQGIYAIKSTGASSVMLYEWCDESCVLTDLDEVWTRFYFYLKNLNPTGLSGSETFFFVDSNCCCGDIVTVQFKKVGSDIKLHLESFEMGKTDDGATALQANTWYCLELYVQHGNSATITLKLNGATECEVNGDNEVNPNYNRMDRLVIESLGHGTYYDYLVIDYVKITNEGWMGTNFDEQNRIHISNSARKAECAPISWREGQVCDVALREVPLRAEGEVIDTDTYTLKNRVIFFVVRLTDYSKYVLKTIYDKSEMTTIRVMATTSDYEWVYTGWFRKNPRIYEYSKSDGDEREWICELEFAVSTFTYQAILG